MGDWVYLVAWSLLLALSAAMVYLAWWALFHDRPNGRRRCPRCWYDLTYAPDAAPGLICSECGHGPKRESQLHRTRRRWGHLVVALLVCLGIATFVQERTARRGWSATMPTRALLIALPFVDHTSPMYHELLDRAEMNRLTEHHWVALMSRCAAGDLAASPPDRAWREKYGLVISHVRRVLAGDLVTGLTETNPDQPYRPAEMPLLEIPPRIELRTPREVWPEDEMVWAALSLLEWWPAESEVRLKIAPMIDGAPARVIRYAPRAHRPGWVGLPVAAVRGDIESMPVSIEALHRRGEREPWRSAGVRTVSLTVRAAPRDAELIKPAGDEDDRLAALVRAMFRGELVRWAEGGPSPVRFRYSLRRPLEDDFETTAIGAVMELRRGDELARRLEIWWLAGADPPARPGPRLTRSRRAFSPRNLHWRIDYENLDLLAELDPADDRWRMHVRGDRTVALRVPDAKRYWAGELDVPIMLHESPGSAPERDVWIE